MNVINNNEPIWCKGTRLVPYCEFVKSNANDIRLKVYKFVDNGGWHFSYLGGAEMIKYKIESFAHQEFNKDRYKDIDKIVQYINQGKDLFNRGGKYKTVRLDANFPEYILQNKGKYGNLITTSCESQMTDLGKVIKSHEKKKKIKQFLKFWKTG